MAEKSEQSPHLYRRAQSQRIRVAKASPFVIVVIVRRTAAFLLSAAAASCITPMATTTLQSPRATSIDFQPHEYRFLVVTRCHEY
jgi:hypothetical protein